VELGNGERSIVCNATLGKRHCFDISSDGYVNFALSDASSGDSKEAVRARTAFLDSGAYEKVSDTLTELVLKHAEGGSLTVDAGCGEGYYSTRLAAEGVSVFGVDISKNAIAHAAKRAKRGALKNAFFAVASVFELPLRDASVDCVTSVFAPCAEEEFCRVLCPGGVLIVVGAGERHLMGLKRAIYDDIYENAGRADLPQGMVLLEEYTVEREIEVTGEEQIAHLFSMTPYYWRTSRADADKLRGLQSLTTTVAFDFKIYQKSK
jgi:23S rRNA (guanine745-N1)-methyltransferase